MPTCLLIKKCPHLRLPEVNVLKVDAPGPDRRGWKRSHSEIDPNLLPAGWKKRVADGANFVLQETWAPHTKIASPFARCLFCVSQILQVKANDPHYASALMLYESARLDANIDKPAVTHETLRTQRFGLLRIHTEPEVCIARSARDRRTITRGTGPSVCNLGSGRRLFGFSGSWTVS